MSDPRSKILRSLEARLGEVRSRKQRLVSASAKVKDVAVSRLLKARRLQLIKCETNCRLIRSRVLHLGISTKSGKRKRHVAATTAAKAVLSSKSI